MWQSAPATNSADDPAKKDFLGGRGADLNTANSLHKQQVVREEEDGIDEFPEEQVQTDFIAEHSRKIVNEVKSPDVEIELSANPYQGCEHGCAYCCARPTRTYRGFSAGLDFERKILFKEDAVIKVLHQICETNGGKLGDSRFGTRMKGEGALVASIVSLLRQTRKRYFGESRLSALNCDAFIRLHTKQLGLF